MPLEFAAEALLRFLFEVIFYTLGYATGWLLVPVLSFGYYTAELLPPPKRRSKRAQASGVTRPRQLSADVVATIGILFWAVMFALVALFWWVEKA